MKLPPRDSWITLDAGASVNIDAALNDRWHRMTVAFRTVRGSILAAAFEVEYTLDSILTEAFFPELQSAESRTMTDNTQRDPDSSAVLRSLFDELFLKDRPASFSTKIQLFKKLRTRLPKLAETLSTDLVKHLQEVLKWRNRFAHYPVTFAPCGTRQHQELKAKLVCNDKEEELTEQLLKDIESLFASTQRDLASVLTKLKSPASS